jgi:L-alanine-DL-glutamate epimerase-like enolase superfamily enzyme
LTTPRIESKEGMIAVPDRPGSEIKISEDALSIPQHTR